MELKRELDEMAVLLKDLQQGAKSLLKDPLTSTNVAVMSANERCLKATSSWGRSTTPRARPAVGAGSKAMTTTAASAVVDYDRIARAEKMIKAKAPAFSMSKSSRPSLPETSNTGRDSQGTATAYDIKIDALSTHAKVKGVFFGSTTREDTTSTCALGHSKRLRHELDAEAKQQPAVENSSESSPSPAIAVNASKERKGYSFGKASREPTAVEEIGSNNRINSALDIAKAERYLWGNASAPIMKPPIKPDVMRVVTVRSNDPLSPSSEGGNDNKDGEQLTGAETTQQANPTNQTAIGATEVEDIKATRVVYERLSKHTTSPAVSFGKVSSPSMRVKLSHARSAVNVGPGYYETTKDDMFALIQRDKHHGKVYHASKAERPRSASVLNKFTATPGPGYYAVEKSDQLVRHMATRSISFGQPASATAEAKITPQLERKRIREEKLLDIRDFHDHRNLANDSFTSARPRVSTVKLAPPPDETLDPVRFKIKREREYEQQRLEAIAQELQRQGADAKFDAIETGPKVMVSMSAQVNAKKSLSEFLSQHPGVLKVKADKMEAEANRDVFYGPQLPVQWAPERDTEGEVNLHITVDNGPGDDDFPASPTEDIRAMLEERKRRKAVDGGPGSQQWPGKVTAKVSNTSESATAAAYLKSSLSGSLAKKPLAIYRDSSESATVSRKHLLLGYTDPSQAEFIGPQLPIDWSKQIEENDRKSLKMSLSKGRDDIKIHRKGVVEIKEFSSHVVSKDDHMGPGVYAGDEILTDFGKQQQGVRFEKMVARDQMVGPRGEKPENTKVKLHELLDDPYYAETELDIDYGIAKDTATAQKQGKNAMKLYMKERFEEEPVTADEQGKLSEPPPADWFKGMYEEVQSQMRGAIDFGKMQGRRDTLVDDALLSGGEFMKEELIVEVKDWNPRMPRAPVATFKDPDKYPRFPEESTNGASELDASAPELDIGAAKAMLSGYRETPFLVDMSKMPSRDDRNDGYLKKAKELEVQAQIKQAVGGQTDRASELEIYKQREEAMKVAIELTSKELKRAPHVDMSKQRGRFELGAAEASKVAAEEVEGNMRKSISPVKDPRDLAHARVKGGVGDWSKAPASTNNAAEKFLGHEKEELVLNLDNQGALSRFKEVKGGPTWASTVRNGVDSGRFPPPVVSAAPDVVYEGADPTKFKKGFTKIGDVGASKASFSNQKGRGADPREELAMRELIGESEQIDIAPSDAALQPHSRGARMGSSKPPVAPTATALGTSKQAKQVEGRTKQTSTGAGNEAAIVSAIVSTNIATGEASEGSSLRDKDALKKRAAGKVTFQVEEPLADRKPVTTPIAKPGKLVGTDSGDKGPESSNARQQPPIQPQAEKLPASTINTTVEEKTDAIRGGSTSRRRRDLSFEGVKSGTNSDSDTGTPLSSRSAVEGNPPLGPKIANPIAPTRPNYSGTSGPSSSIDSPVNIRAPDIIGARPLTPKGMGDGTTESQLLEKLNKNLSSMNI